MEMINAIGRRKSSVARVYLSEGTGKITINKKDISVYFPSAILQYVVKQPLNLLEVAEKYDIKANLDGGGFTGQSQALRLAIARALVKVNAEDKKALKVQGFLTSDSREVERKTWLLTFNLTGIAGQEASYPQGLLVFCINLNAGKGNSEGESVARPQ